LEDLVLNGDVTQRAAVEDRLARRRARRQEATNAQEAEQAARAARRLRRDEAGHVSGLPLRRGPREAHEDEVERKMATRKAKRAGLKGPEAEDAAALAEAEAAASSSRRGGMFGFGQGAGSASGFAAELGPKELDLVVRGARDEGANVKASKMYDDVQRMRRKQKKERLTIMKELGALRAIVSALARDEKEAEGAIGKN
jgi:hypothetical protein